jgi:hypothetical protein
MSPVFRTTKTLVHVTVMAENRITVLHGRPAFSTSASTYLTPWSYSPCRTLAASRILCEASWQQIFTRLGSSAPRPTPNLEDQGISLSLAPPSKPVRHGWLYQQLHCCRHSFRVYWCTQAPSPSNNVLSTRSRYHPGGLSASADYVKPRYCILKKTALQNSSRLSTEFKSLWGQ